MKYVPEIKLVGIRTTTSNAFEANPQKAKIGSTIQSYFKNELEKSLVGRTKPGTTYCVYTEYESDEHGSYTYFIGVEKW